MNEIAYSRISDALKPKERGDFQATFCTFFKRATYGLVGERPYSLNSSNLDLCLTELERLIGIVRSNCIDEDWAIEELETLYYQVEAKKRFPQVESLPTEEIADTTNVEPTQGLAIERGIEWLGTPSELACLMLKLAENGYVNASTKPDGTINSQGYHRQIEKSFTLNSGKMSSVLTELKCCSLSADNPIYKWAIKAPENTKG